MPRFALMVLLLGTLSGCGSKEVILTPIETGLVGDTGESSTGTDTDTAPMDTDTAPMDTDTAPVDTGPTDEELDAIWGDARLIITTPASGAFLPYLASSAFAAEVVDSDGNPMDFTDIHWSSDIDPAWTPVGASFTDATLHVGTHALTATADLPNGDRLAYTIGGVLVQSDDAGIYVGDLSMDVTASLGGTDYTASCTGAITLTVDAEGDAATGDSACTIPLFGFDTDATNAVDLALATGVMTGSVSLSLSFFSYDFDATGTVGDGAMEAAWTDSVYGIATVDGTLSATRVTRDTTGG